MAIYPTLQSLGSALTAASSTGTKTFTQFGASIANLTKNQLANLLVTNNQTLGYEALNSVQMRKALIDAGVSKEIANATVKQVLQTNATKAQDVANKASMFSLAGLKNGIKGLAASFKALSTASKVMLAITAAIIVFKAASAVIDKINPSLETLTKNVEKAKEKYTETTSEIQSVEDELKKVSDRIKEISGLPSLSLNDKDELSGLKETNKELQTRLDLLKMQKESDQADTNEAVKKQYEKDMQTPDEKSSVYTHTETFRGQTYEAHDAVSEEEYAKQAIRRIEELNKKKAEGNELTDVEQARYDLLLKDLTSIGVKYSGFAKDYSVDDETRQSWVSFSDLINKTLDPEKWYKENADAAAKLVSDYQAARDSGDESAITS